MRKIENTIYRITFDNYRIEKVECQSEEELFGYLAHLIKQGRNIISVVRVDIYADAIRSPRVSFRNDKRFKELLK